MSAANFSASCTRAKRDGRAALQAGRGARDLAPRDGRAQGRQHLRVQAELPLEVGAVDGRRELDAQRHQPLLQGLSRRSSGTLTVNRSP